MADFREDSTYTRKVTHLIPNQILRFFEALTVTKLPTTAFSD